MWRLLPFAVALAALGLEIFVAPFGWAWPSGWGGVAHWSGETRGRQIALTFDDGPSAYTETLLDWLDAEGLPATFFVMGRQAERYPATVARMAREGHQVENHGYSLTAPQALGALLYRDVPADEVSRTQNVVEKLTGRAPAYFRPPGGQLGRPLLRAVRSQGLETVYAGLPIANPNEPAEPQLRAATLSLVPGAILVLHDGDDHEPDSERPLATLELLPELLAEIRRRELVATTLSDLLGAR